MYIQLYTIYQVHCNNQFNMIWMKSFDAFCNRQVVNQNNINVLFYFLSILFYFLTFSLTKGKQIDFFFLEKIIWKSKRKGYLSLAKIIPHIYAKPFQLTKSCWPFKPNVSQSICRSPLLTSQLNCNDFMWNFQVQVMELMILNYCLYVYQEKINYKSIARHRQKTQNFIFSLLFMSLFESHTIQKNKRRYVKLLVIFFVFVSLDFLKS